MQIEPLNDRIVVTLEQREKTTASGIVIPDGAKSNTSNLAQVVVAGPGRTTDNGELIKTRVTIGDRVLITQGAGQVATVDGEDITIIRKEEILAIVNKGE